MANFATIIAFFSICGANLFMIMAPTKATIHTSAFVLVFLRYSCLSQEISLGLLSIRVAIAYLVIVD